MKFRYQYRTKDNEIRCGEIAAADRDAAYAVLKAQGIKASRMEEAPGVFNKLFGKGKRWLVIGALGALCAVLWAYLKSTKQDLAEATRIDDCVPRHQIYGDPEIVARFASFDGLVSVLGNEGDATLACFAQPGKMVEPGKGANPAALLEAATSGRQTILSDDPREIRELKQIVNWIRSELIAYVDNPSDARDRTAKLKAYFQRLQQRVSEEKRIYQMTEQELLNNASEELSSERNAKLRRLGLPTIVVDEK